MGPLDCPGESPTLPKHLYEEIPIIVLTRAIQTIAVHSRLPRQRTPFLIDRSKVIRRARRRGHCLRNQLFFKRVFGIDLFKGETSTLQYITNIISIGAHCLRM